MTPEAQQTLDSAHQIASGYGGNLTVRQLYYRLVALDQFPESRRWIKLPGGSWQLDLVNGSKNADPNYKWLIGLLTDARLAGDFPMEWLLDRTRDAKKGKFTGNQDDVDNALGNIEDDVRNAPDQWLWRDRWYGQPKHVSVWVEKEALAGVFDEPCERLGVGYFVLRGYSSLSGLSQWVNNVGEQHEIARFDEAIVLYFGDHDPDGWEIPRSAERNIHKIAHVTGVELPDVTFQRVALVGEQIRQYRPPPFPAKESSARYQSYVDEHGLTDAWELDALEPALLDRLIRDNVAEHFDDNIFRGNVSFIEDRREQMRDRMTEPGWAEGLLE